MTGGGLMNLVKYGVQYCIFHMYKDFYVPFPDNINKTIKFYIYVLKDKSYNYQKKHYDYVYKNINKLLQNKANEQII